MKTLLIRPPQISPTEFLAAPRTGLPLDLLLIAAVLEKEGFEVEIFDAFVECGLALFEPEEKRVHVDMMWDEIKERIRKSEAEIVYINDPFNNQPDAALWVAALAKEVLPQCLVAAGGAHASLSAETFLVEGAPVDIVVLGEGECALPRLIDWLEGKLDISGVEGIVYRKNGKVEARPHIPRWPDLDGLPLPSYHLLDLERYFQFEKGGLPQISFSYPGSERAVSIVTSRGCPLSCIFCRTPAHRGNTWRAHSPEYVVDHIRYLAAEYGVRHIHFEDDHLTLSKERFEAILDGLLEENIKITWDTPNGVGADVFDKNLLRKCKRAGCTYLAVGAESGAQRTLARIINKPLELRDVERMAGDCQTVGVDLHAFFLIGFPGERKTDMQKTLDYALFLKKRFNVFPHLTFAYPLIGTELYALCKRKGYLTVAPTLDMSLGRPVDKRTQTGIQTEDFRGADLCKLSASFRRKLRRVSLFRSGRFLLSNPRIFFLIASLLFRNLLKHPFKAKSLLKSTYSRYLIFENLLKAKVRS